MATVNATESKIFEKGGDTKLQNVSGKNWLSFFDAIGWAEASSTYNTNNKFGYYGIYQQNKKLLDTVNFYDSFGKMLGVSTMSEFQKNPIAQEIVGIMEFAGIPSSLLVGKSFTSKYNATIAAFSDAVKGIMKGIKGTGYLKNISLEFLYM